MDKLNDLFTRIITKLNKKVDSVEGKQLSTEDFTSEEKTKLQGIADEAQVNTIESISLNGTNVEPDGEKNVEIKAYNEDNKPEVGGRNLLLNSGVQVTNSNYLIKYYSISDKTLKDGEKVTVTLKGTLGSGKHAFSIYNTDGERHLFELSDKGNGYYQVTDSWFHSESGNHQIRVYTLDEAVQAESTIEWIKLERGEVATDWTPAPEDLAPIDEQKILAQIANRTYQGTDLTVKFKSEIDGSFNGNPWAWIQDRINNDNWDGLHVCDYIPFTTTNNVTMQAQIAGMDTYYQYGDLPFPHHIDFITREVWPTPHPINSIDYNNGTAEQNYPWLASDMYLWLNSKAGPVPNAATVNPKTTEVDYTTDGVYYFLPEELKAVIIEKRFLLETRYNASSLLTTSPGWDWQNEGKLWLPTEMEVYGTNVWGGAGFPAGGGIQYPIFANSMNRLKYRSGSRYNWWLSTPGSGNSTHWCYVSAYGNAYYYTATLAWIGAPVCFRIASTVKTADEEYLEDEILEQPLPE